MSVAILPTAKVRAAILRASVAFALGCALQGCVPAENETSAPAPSPVAAPTPIALHPSPIATPAPRVAAPSPRRVIMNANADGSSGAESGEQQSAQLAVDRAALALDQVNREKLSGQSVADYDVVEGLVRSARRAMTEQDFLRAKSLAEKATMLAGQLSANSGTSR